MQGKSGNAGRLPKPAVTRLEELVTRLHLLSRTATAFKGTPWLSSINAHQTSPFWTAIHQPEQAPRLHQTACFDLSRRGSSNVSNQFYGAPSSVFWERPSTTHLN